ncbi:unnamed protein product [Peniophora sp. CBMAI 1063]|nr:unnamed protein product [Peniophora sp. CBMAI 1063]
MDLTTTLPAEILAHIFACVQAVDPMTGNRDDAPGWTRVTAVCSRWRHVVIAEAALWAHWTPELCLFGGGLEMFIARSKSALVSVSTGKSRSCSQRFRLLETLVKHVNRVRALSLSCVDTDHDLYLVPIKIVTDNSFEFLVSCHVQIDYLFPEDIKVPLVLFRGQAPRLRHLVLDFRLLSLDVLDWTSSIFNNLISLDLTMLREQYIFDTADIVNPLRRMTNLSLLAIEHWEDFDTHSEDEDEAEHGGLDANVSARAGISARASGDPIAVLPCLKLFVIVARPDYFRRFLPNILLPPSASVALASRLVARNALSFQDYEALSRGLLSDSRTAKVAPYRAAYLAFDTWPRECVILKCTHEPLPSSAYPGQHPRSVFHAKERHYSDNYDLSLHLAEPHISNFLPHLFADHVTMLTLNKLPSNLNARLLRPFTGVTHLRILGPLSKSTLSFLFEPEDLVLPALQEIDFADIRGLKDLLAYFKFGSRHGWHHFWALERILSVRREEGHPLRSVYVHVQDESQLVNEGCLKDVGFGNWKLDKMRSALALLDDFDEVQIVEKDIDVFLKDS